MSKKTIIKNLRRVLLNGEPFEMALFDFELREHIEEYMESKRADNNEFLFAVTEHTNDVAMMLIDEQDNVHINEDARAMLQSLWPDTYFQNLEKIIPEMATQLHAGYLFMTGVNTMGQAQWNILSRLLAHRNRLKI